MSRPVILKRELGALRKDFAPFGERTVLFSEEDDVTSPLQGLTYGILYPGQKINWFCHDDKDEFFLVQKGKALIHFVEGEPERIEAGNMIYLRPGTRHYLENDGEEPFEAYFLRIYSKNTE